MASPADEKPKIIVDEDWKSQVQAEREAAARSAENAPEGGQAEDAGGEPLPDASLASLVITLATQAMAAMGLLAGPDGQPLPADFEQARYLIDTLGMLQEKTTGNRTDEETQLIDDALHQLRMTFVAVQQQPQPGR